MLTASSAGKQEHSAGLCTPRGSPKKMCLCRSPENLLSWIAQYKYSVSGDVLAKHSSMQAKGELYIRMVNRRIVDWLDGANKRHGGETTNLIEYWRVQGDGSTVLDCHNYHVGFNATYRCALDSQNIIVLTLAQVVGAPPGAAGDMLFESGTFVEDWPEGGPRDPRPHEVHGAVTLGGGFPSTAGTTITTVKEPSQTYSDDDLDPSHCKDWRNYIDHVDPHGFPAGPWKGPDPKPSSTTYSNPRHYVQQTSVNEVLRVGPMASVVEEDRSLGASAGRAMLPVGSVRGLAGVSSAVTGEAGGSGVVSPMKAAEEGGVRGGGPLALVDESAGVMAARDTVESRHAHG